MCAFRRLPDVEINIYILAKFNGGVKIGSYCVNFFFQKSLILFLTLREFFSLSPSIMINLRILGVFQYTKSIRHSYFIWQVDYF